MAINEDKLNQFVEKTFGDLGATFSGVLVLLGDRLGIYKAMADGVGVSPAELARKTRLNERYLREWLLNQAAGGYVEYNKDTQRFRLPPEQAMVLADEHSPVFMPGGFQVCASAFMDADKIEQGFRTGKGVDWGDHHPCLFEGTERFFRPAYEANLVQKWIPALEGVDAKLRQGAVVADVGCGHAASTLIMAKAYPNSQFTGFDAHAPSIERATRLAEKEGVSKNCEFKGARSTDFPGPAVRSGMSGRTGGYDLVCCFDCLHDMGDPVGDGTWMIVEPFAGDHVEDNLNPIGRAFAAGSTMICVPHSLAHHGPALGAQAGEAKLREVVMKGGFTRFRRATQTPFNLILEARI
jgi:SAM-dependent methyltransferase